MQRTDYLFLKKYKHQFKSRSLYGCFLTELFAVYVFISNMNRAPSNIKCFVITNTFSVYNNPSKIKYTIQEMLFWKFLRKYEHEVVSKQFKPIPVEKFLTHKEKLIRDWAKSSSLR